MNKKYEFKQCFCCHKNFEISQLNNINLDSVIIGEERLNFSEIILDCCSTLVPVSY